jgi:hypothetical protein
MMSDHDELLARTDQFLALGNQAAWSTARQLILDLRATLATRPQPPDLRPVRQAVFDAVMDHYGYDEADMDDQSDASDLVNRIMTNIAVAVAGSATPTEEDGLRASIEAEADIIAESVGTYSAEGVARILRALVHTEVAAATSTTETGRICPRSFARDPSQHTDPTDTVGWGVCRMCGETVNTRGKYMPEHRWASAGSATPKEDT